MPDPLSRANVEAVLADLVRIPSVNPSLARDESAGEAEAAAFAREWMAARGIDAWLEEAAPARPNAVGRVGSGAGPTLILCAHLDTVSAHGMTIAPFEPRVQGDRLYGRGAYDMKGGVAAILAAMAALCRGELAGTVLAALVADEEYASIGADDFVRRHPDADGCIVTEPSAGELVLAHKGFVWLELETRGAAAHGSRWDLGVSAVARMGRIIAALDAFDREALRARTHPLVGPASMHCAVVEGGSGLSTYAERCTLKVERRTLPGETPEQVEAEVADVIRAAGEEAEIRRIFSREPLECDRAHPLAAAVRAAAAEVTGREPAESGVAYWMDAAVFAGAGIPAVDIGAAGEGAHAAVEWVAVPSVVENARVLVAAARRFCGGR